MKCPVCGAADMLHDTRNLHYSYRSQTVTVPEVTGDFCHACGEVILDTAEGDRYRAAIDAFIDHVEAAAAKPARQRA
jgi:HTH-type transcriptional regulator/antitoxin MqsA